MMENTRKKLAWRHRAVIVLVSIAAVTTMPPPSKAANLRAVPNISMSVGWDSNVESVVDNEIADGVFRAFPGLVLSLDALGTTFNLSGAVGYEYYFNNPELNTYTRSGVFGLTVTRPIQATHNLTVTPDARYLKQNELYVRNVNVLGSPGAVLPSQALPVNSTTLTQYGAGLGLNYASSASSRLILTGVWSKDLYSSPGLLDTEFKGATLAYEKRFTERTYIGPFVAGNETRYSDSQNSRIYAGGLSGTYQITDAWRVGLRAGASKWFLEDEQPVVIREEGVEPYGNLDFYYSFGTWHGAFGGSYQTQGMGGVQSVVKTVSGYGNMVKNVTEHCSFSLEGGYTRNISVTSPSNINRYWYSMARLMYRITPNIDVYFLGSNMNSTLQESGGADMAVNRSNIFLGFDARKQYTIF